MGEQQPATWLLRLYVNGASPHSVAAIENVQRICDEELVGRVDFRVVDVRTEPAQALRDNVLVAPTLVKRLPAPIRRVVGDLADADRVRRALDIEPVAAVPPGIG
jgi:circadian clock protein KaiB